MTPLTYHERSERVFGYTISTAQEGAVSGDLNTFKAFSLIVPQAQEAQDRGSNPGLKAMTYQESGGKATFTRSRFKVKPSISDFVVDVHNVSKKTLTASEFGYFQRTYFGKEFLGIADMSDSLDKTADGQDKFFAAYLEKYPEGYREEVYLFDKRIRQKLGAAFIEYGLHPFDIYMNHADQDVRKKVEN